MTQVTASTIRDYMAENALSGLGLEEIKQVFGLGERELLSLPNLPMAGRYSRTAGINYIYATNPPIWLAIEACGIRVLMTPKEHRELTQVILSANGGQVDIRDFGGRIVVWAAGQGDGEGRGSVHAYTHDGVWIGYVQYDDLSDILAIS